MKPYVIPFTIMVILSIGVVVVLIWSSLKVEKMFRGLNRIEDKLKNRK
jgi:hypothetical protein